MSNDIKKISKEKLQQQAKGGFFRKPDPDAMFELGCRSYDAKENMDAIAWFKQSAELGNVEAFCRLGLMFASGQGERNEPKAHEYFLHAAEKGHGPSQYNLAKMYELGRGVAKNVELAASWYHKSLEQGSTSARGALARLYSSGDVEVDTFDNAVRWWKIAAESGNESAKHLLSLDQSLGWEEIKDERASAQWCRFAANRGDVKAQYALGVMCSRGRGVKLDQNKAMYWYKLAASGGNCLAQWALGQIHGEGKITPVDLKESVRWHRLAAEQGYVHSQSTLGDMYANGQGVEVDKVRAVYWHQLAAKQGHEYSQNILGHMFSRGEGGAINNKEAAKWYRLSADQGNPDSQNELGGMYANGFGVEKDEKIAFHWYKLAAEQGIMSAQAAIGHMYDNGSCVKQDYLEAIRYYRLAADQGYAHSMYALGHHYRYGQGIPQDFDEAIRWNRLAAKQGNIYSQSALGDMYAEGHGVNPDAAEAARWHQLAATAGYSNSQSTLASYFLNGFGVQKNEKEAVRWFQLATDQGNAYAQHSLGNLYSQGLGVEKNQSEAFKWYQLAAKNGDSYAQVSLGMMYVEGNAVTQDFLEAVRWFRLSADQGNSSGQDRLGLMYSEGTGVEINPSEAFRLHQLAADQGNSAAQCSLGWAYENGLGVPVDHKLAIHWNKLSSEKGYLEAFNNLGWLYQNGLGCNVDIVEAERYYNIAAKQGHKEAIERLVNLKNSVSENHLKNNNNNSIVEDGLKGGHGPQDTKQSAKIDNEFTRFLDDSFADFIGLDAVREELFRQASYIQIQKMREERGLPKLSTPSKHLVFLGNPGTGKTTVARVIAELYKRIGIVKSDKVVEVDRAGLVAPYIGQTALKTREVVESALGGVLFIDEAYTLARGGDEDFGREAIDTLLKMMEDHRDDFAVIVAGYESEMEPFITQNPGLASRFNRYITFPDYSPEELWDIFAKTCRKNSYDLNVSIKKSLENVFDREIKSQGNRFSNARYIRNLFEKTVEAQSHRLIISGINKNADLQTILQCDVESALGESLSSSNPAVDGFDKVIRRLDQMTGLDGVKAQVRRLADFVRMQRARSDAGFKVADGFSQHIVFTGNPGTGKTTIARLIADLYFSLGVLPSNRCIEVDRSNLVAGYVGQSAIKTKEVIEQAKGGVLFIDEAYTLAPSGSNDSDFGQEVIDTLLKAMEDLRGQFVVIVAGYGEEMRRFIESNPGLKSRFGRYITFDDYLPDQLISIFNTLCSHAEYELDPDAVDFLTASIEVLFAEGQTNGNGRFVRNAFERSVEIQSQRVAKIVDLYPAELKRITKDDIKSSLGELSYQ